MAELVQSGMTAIEVRGLTKACGGVHAVRGIDLTVERGQIFALLGPNGAGKTTTVEILEGYRSRDGGTARVLGYDPARQRQQLKRQIGIVLQSSGMDRYLTVSETVAMYAGFYPRPRPVDEVIELVGLEAKRDAQVLKLSGGQQRRLDFAIALAGNPDLLFLDEPTTGFDPSARHEAWEVIKNLAALGKTVLLTTHYMDEAQYLADQVAVISSGLIMAEGPPATIGNRELARARIHYRLAGGVTPPAVSALMRGQRPAPLEVTRRSRRPLSYPAWPADISPDTWTSPRIRPGSRRLEHRTGSLGRHSASAPEISFSPLKASERGPCPVRLSTPHGYAFPPPAGDAYAAVSGGMLKGVMTWMDAGAVTIGPSRAPWTCMMIWQARCMSRRRS